jgi:hypothetical protein
MRKLVIQLMLVLVVVGAGYLFLFKGKEVSKLAQDAKQQVRGYSAAKSPTEAIDNFRKAIKARDYETAADYCGPEYAEQLRKAHPVANGLGSEIDNLLYKMEERKINSEQVKVVLLLLEPFPNGLVMTVKKQGEDKATALIDEKGQGVKDLGKQQNWKIDLGMIRTLQRGIPGEVEVRKTGDAWKIYFPSTNDLQLTVNHLMDKGQDYTNAINRVKNELQIKSILTRDELESSLRSELEKIHK